MSEKCISGSSSVSDVSIEVGHYYEREYVEGAEHIARIEEKYVPLVAALSEGSTVMVKMIDDYHSQNMLSPADTIQTVLTAAAMNNLRLDYIVREGAFVDYAQATYDKMRSVISETSAYPSAESFMHYQYRREDDEGYRYLYGMEPYRESQDMTREERNARRIGGWIKNDVEIFSISKKKQRGEREHFLDLPDGTRQRVSWSCPWLAMIFQAHRLNMLPEITATGLEPVFMEASDLRDTKKPWHEYPRIIQIEPNAPPYQAGRIQSILDKDYLPVESTVSSLLAAIDPEVAARRGFVLL